MSADAFFQSFWYRRSASIWSLLLAPISWLYHGVVGLRRLAFKAGIIGSARVSRPVIVVGNITVGGTGKTPLTLWLAERLRGRGFTPGIILRGYRGGSPTWPRDVMPDSDPLEVGDEAVLLARLSQGIVVAGPDRVAAARRAIERGADVILSDDGLQHYRLARDCELAVIDAGRGLGNGRLLPAGPLREAASRLDHVDAVALKGSGHGTDVVEGAAAPRTSAPVVTFAVKPTIARSLESGEVRALYSFRGQSVHAVAGIGNPEGFFVSLREAGLTVVPHALPDHALIAQTDVDFGDPAPVLMTEKDAVKCRGLEASRLWAVAAEVAIEDLQAELLLSVVASRIAGFRPSSTDH
jgi:tetraacyldisaccharide 4'-kinase